MTPKQFKQHRLSLNLTQKQLADKLGLSPKYGDDYIRMIEKGKREPSGVLLKLFEYVIWEHQASELFNLKWEFECFNCKKECDMQIDFKSRDVKEGELHIHSDGSYSYYCKDCERNINYN